MKKINLRFDHFITLVEEGRLKVGRYEYERNVDAQGDSHFTAITENGTKLFPKRLHHSIDRKDLTV